MKNYTFFSVIRTILFTFCKAIRNCVWCLEIALCCCKKNWAQSKQQCHCFSLEPKIFDIVMFLSHYGQRLQNQRFVEYVTAGVRAISWRLQSCFGSHSPSAQLDSLSPYTDELSTWMTASQTVAHGYSPMIIYITPMLAQCSWCTVLFLSHCTSRE